MWFLFVETCLMVSTALMGNPPRQNSALKCRRKPWRRRERKRKRYFGAGRVLFVPAEQLDKCCRRKCDLVVPEHQQRWSNADVCCVSEGCLAHQPRWTTRHASCFTDSSLLMAQVCCYNFQDLFPQHKWWPRSLFQHLRRFTWNRNALQQVGETVLGNGFLGKIIFLENNRENWWGEVKIFAELTVRLCQWIKKKMSGEKQQTRLLCKAWYSEFEDVVYLWETCVRVSQVNSFCSVSPATCQTFQIYPVMRCFETICWCSDANFYFFMKSPHPNNLFSQSVYFCVLPSCAVSFAFMKYAKTPCLLPLSLT